MRLVVVVGPPPPDAQDAVTLRKERAGARADDVDHNVKALAAALR
jgi:hypothetical protein